MSLKSYVSIFYFIILVSDKSRLSQGTKCSTLYSKPRNLGSELIIRSGQRVDNLYVHKDWEDTRSVAVEKTCSLLICDGPKLSQPCKTFEHGSYPITFKGDVSVECNCTIAKQPQWTNMFIKSTLCARVFLKGGKSYHLDLPVNEQYFPAKWKDSVETVVLRKGCVMSIFKEVDNQGERLILKREITKDFNRPIGSYECSCDDTQFERRSRPPRSKNYPKSVNVPNNQPEALKMYVDSKHSLHEGIGAALRNDLNRRSLKNVYILVLGTTGSGKSFTINSLFDNKNLTVVGDTSSTTRDIREYRITVPIEELGLANTELRVIDTPGLGDTNGIFSDAQSLAALDEYLASHEELSSRIPNIVLIVHQFNDNRFEGVGSQFTKMLRGFDSFKDRITDRQFSNVIFMFTHYSKASKLDQNKPNNRIRLFKQAIEDVTSFPKPIHIVVGENKGLEAELPMINGYFELPNGEYYPRNLFDKLELITNSTRDMIGQGVFRTAFRDAADLVVSEAVIGKAPKDEQKVLKYLDLLNEHNFQFQQTEISTKLQNTWVNEMPIEVKEKYRNSLIYLQSFFKLKELHSESSLPKTDIDKIKLLAQIKKDKATRYLLEKGLGIRAPKFKEDLIVGQGYNVFNDKVLPQSPFKLGLVKESDIGFLIPKGIICDLKPGSNDKFVVVENKKEYVSQRLKDLGIGVHDIDMSLDRFSFNLKSGYNLGEISFEGEICQANAKRNVKLFGCELTEKLELNEDFKGAVRRLRSFNESSEENVENWKQFFDKYGTHVVQAVQGGGLIKITVKDNDLCSEQDIVKLLEFLKVVENLPLILSNDANVPKNYTKLKFVQHSLKFYGGDGNAIGVKDLSEFPLPETIKTIANWKESLQYNPIMLSSNLKLVPISHIAELLGESYKTIVENATALLFKSKLTFTPPPSNQENTPPPPREETPYSEYLDSLKKAMEVLKMFKDIYAMIAPFLSIR